MKKKRLIVRDRSGGQLMLDDKDDGFDRNDDAYSQGQVESPENRGQENDVMQGVITNITPVAAVPSNGELKRLAELFKIVARDDRVLFSFEKEDPVVNRYGAALLGS